MLKALIWGTCKKFVFYKKQFHNSANLIKRFLALFKRELVHCQISLYLLNGKRIRSNEVSNRSDSGSSSIVWEGRMLPVKHHP